MSELLNVSARSCAKSLKPKSFSPENISDLISNGATEFILSMYDRDNGRFPKGETAVLTAVEKDYGEQFINPAKQFIEAIHAKFEEFHGYKDPEIMDAQAPEELEDIRHLAGI